MSIFLFVSLPTLPVQSLHRFQREALVHAMLKRLLKHQSMLVLLKFLASLKLFRLQLVFIYANLSWIFRQLSIPKNMSLFLLLKRSMIFISHFFGRQFWYFLWENAKQLLTLNLHLQYQKHFMDFLEALSVNWFLDKFQFLPMLNFFVQGSACDTLLIYDVPPIFSSMTLSFDCLPSNYYHFYAFW